MPFRLLLLSLLVAACGCGLSEYEEKMADAEKRLKEWNEEEKALGPPIKMPTKQPLHMPGKGKEVPKPPEKDKEVKKGPAEPLTRFFLRLPRGVSPTPNENLLPDTEGKPIFYLYVVPPAKEPPKDKFKGPPIKPPPPPVCPYVMIAVNKPDPLTGKMPEKFRERVVAAAALLIEQYSLEKPKATELVFEARPHGREKVTFARTLLETGLWTYSVNVWTGNREQVAIVYAWQKGRQAEAGPAVDLSLRTFGGGVDMARATMKYSLGGPLGKVPSLPGQ
jgi:hypothetical protein